MSDTETTKNETEQTQKYLLSDDTFNRLREAQITIREKTGVTPSFKKLISDLVTGAAIAELTERYIEKFTM